MSAPTPSAEFYVDPSRLASGMWCHKRERQIGEGDISRSYSADKIALEGRVRKPFAWKHGLWVCTSLHSLKDRRNAEAYRLVPERFFDGQSRSYQEVCMNADEGRRQPEGFYHGMQARHGKDSYVLVGPKALFIPKEEAETLKQADLLDAL